LEVLFVRRTTEIDSEVESYGRESKSAARRRVDAYHEAMRERLALRELEQPFVLDASAQRPGR
jgi:uncharacterized protein YjiS (DUF1127 family)